MHKNPQWSFNRHFQKKSHLIFIFPLAAGLNCSPPEFLQRSRSSADQCSNSPAAEVYLWILLWWHKWWYFSFNNYKLIYHENSIKITNQLKLTNSFLTENQTDLLVDWLTQKRRPTKPGISNSQRWQTLQVKGQRSSKHPASSDRRDEGEAGFSVMKAFLRSEARALFFRLCTFDGSMFLQNVMWSAGDQQPPPPATAGRGV